MEKKAIETIVSFLLTNDDSNSSSEDEFTENEEDIISICDDEIEILSAIIMINETRGEVIPTEKLSSYVERVIPSYSRITFKEHFR